VHTDRYEKSSYIHTSTHHHVFSTLFCSLFSVIQKVNERIKEMLRMKHWLLYLNCSHIISSAHLSIKATKIRLDVESFFFRVSYGPKVNLKHFNDIHPFSPCSKAGEYLKFSLLAKGKILKSLY
jgi:hypothetical protein